MSPKIQPDPTQDSQEKDNIGISWDFNHCCFNLQIPFRTMMLCHLLSLARRGVGYVILLA